MTRHLSSWFSAFPFVATLVAAGPALGATLQTNVNYGANGAVMNVYVPDNADDVPGIVVSLHYCGGAASNAASWLTSLAEQYGFIVIAPGLPAGDADGCWDVGSSQSLTHDGGSHSKAIAQMVQYSITQYGADANRVFAVGASSGAMMTNVLLGAYPDVFKAGSVLAGVPFGCWTAGDGWTSACADGNTSKSAAQWGDQVRSAYAGFSGTRPRVQLFHGTSDTTLNYKNLAEEIKQWTNVLGLSETPTSTEQNAPKSGWTRTNYESAPGSVALEVAIGQGVGHDLTGQNLWNEVMRFFALDEDAPSGGTGGTGGGGQAGNAGGPTAGAGATGSGGMPTGGVSSGGVPSAGAGNGGSAAGGASSPAGGSSGVASGGSGNAGSSSGGTTGGAQTGTGGAPNANGGAMTAAGGTSSGGSANGTGGSTSSAGAVGGASIGAAGAPTGAAPPSLSDEGSCSYRLPAAAGRDAAAASLLLLGALGLLIRRRRP